MSGIRKSSNWTLIPRFFSPLAKLLRDSQQPDKAIEVLRAGLRHSSVFLEARLLLIQILFEQSRAGECSEELSTVTGLLERYPAFWEVWAESVSEKNRDLALAIRLMASTIRHPEHSLSLILESGLGILQDVRRSFSSSQSIEASDSEPPCGRFPRRNALHGYALRAGTIFLYGTQVEESSIADAELLESMLEESAPVREHPSCVTPFLPNKAKSVHWVDPDEDSDLMADENPEEPTLRTRSMADVLAEQGDIVGALEIYQELEAAAPTPEEARELHDSVARIGFPDGRKRYGTRRADGNRRTFVWRRGRAESVDVPSGVVSGSPRSTGARIARRLHWRVVCPCRVPLLRRP